AEGLELVRIGNPQRPELAAWRYGEQLARRRGRALLIGGVAAGGALAVFGGVQLGLVAAGSTQLVNLGAQAWNMYRNVLRSVARIETSEGHRVDVMARHVLGTEMFTASNNEPALTVGYYPVFNT